MIDFGRLARDAEAAPQRWQPFRTAVVTMRTPLQIRLESDSQPLPITPVTLVDPATLTVGDRVMVVWQITPGRASGSVMVIGKIYATP